MIVYHGTTEIVRNPDIVHSYRQLDFGKGFYVTTVMEQAKRWARRKADILGKEKAILDHRVLVQILCDTEKELL